MGAYGSKQLLEALERLHSNDPTLTALNYEHSGLGDDAAKQLAKALVGNHVLRRLRLGGCNLTSSGIHSVCRSLCDNRVVPARIRKLELGTSSTNSHSLPVGNPLGDNGARSLALLLEQCSSLRHLTLSSCNIGDEGAVILAGALRKNHTLTTLDLGHNSISDLGVEQIGNALAINSSLKGLSLWKNRLFHSGAEALAHALTTNTTLQWLGLGCNHVGDEGVKALAIALLSNAQYSSLTWLGLGGNEISDRGVEHIAVAIMAQRNHAADETDGIDGETSSQASLTEQIRGGGLRPMLELGVTPSHVSIAVGDDEISEETPDSAGCDDDVERSTHCIPLESIGLGGNQITCAGATMLASGLKTNTRLLSLGLADNRIGDSGATALAELLRYTDTLQKLILSGNDIHDDGGSTLIASLSQNTSLTSLYLAENPLGDGVGVRCEEVIGKHNHSLRVLDLHDTRLSSPALTSLFEMMQKQGVLQSLGLRGIPHSVAPPTQNMMEGTTAPPTLYRQNIVSTTVAPSQRHTTLEALGSLPLPDESAQTMVVTQAHSRTRRGSISQYIKKKLSKSSSHSRGFRVPEDTPTSHNHHRTNHRSPIELLPLTEEDPASFPDGPSHMTYTESKMGSAGPSPNKEGVNKGEIRRASSRLSREQMEYEGPHPQPHPTGTMHRSETVERIAGITNRDTILTSPEHGEMKPVKEQWVTALRMRVGMLKMGGFLHSGFNALQTAESANERPIAATLPSNLSKNRISAPSPPDSTRVRLQLVMEELGSDYINASFVGSPGHPKSYIVTQSPTVDTVGDMWRMVWEQRVCVIVVLTCEGEVVQWWPEEGTRQTHPLVVGREWTQGPLNVTTTSESVSMTNPDLLVRSCDLHSSADNERETVTMYHYTAWPQNSAPSSVGHVADMYHNMLKSRLQQTVSSPVLVVSAMGGGRSGCFAAVAIAHELMVSPDPNPPVWDYQDPNILDQVIRGIRMCRPGLVETAHQYEACHLILEGVLSGPPRGGKGGKNKKGEGRKWNPFRKKSLGNKERLVEEVDLDDTLLF